MKTILCYGDSNTYGYNPANGFRYPKNIRWTGRLQELLGDEYLILEEGCNGRTTVFDDPDDKWKNGLTYLKPCLNTHKPVDMVILMLGSNDLKTVFHADAEKIAEGAEQLVQEIYDFSDSKQSFRPDVILVSPPIIGDAIGQSGFRDAFDETAITRSQQFAMYYKEAALRKECCFLDAAKYVTSSDIDSLHLMPEEHKKLASGLYAFIQNELLTRTCVKTRRLVMQPYNLKSMQTLEAKETDPEMKQAYGEMISCMEQNSGKEYWGAAWEIALHSGKRVGDLCFKGTPDGNGAVEIGYGIDAEYAGNGYATEMVSAMAHWASVQPDVKLVTAQTEPSNEASQKVLKKSGFVQDGYGEEGPRFVYHM